MGGDARGGQSRGLAGRRDEESATAPGRAPTEQETADAVQFITDQAESYKKDGKADAERLGLTDWRQVLMELNEFIYVD